MRKKEIEVRIDKILEEITNLSQEYIFLRTQVTNLNRKISQERIFDEYINDSKYMKYKNSYDVISLCVASLLKEKGVPVNTKAIYEYLVNHKNLSISYNNFLNNYMRKIHDDKNVNVERAYRGYYQYRRKIKTY